ncbi:MULTISPECIES: rod shape-determining protein [Pelosinus]|uniref:Cell shape-determining protein MreB n=1 Tax=Pelosinus fermentans B4 TaxID=1149862 RepID=I8REF7_9FIRM|nr:MULTISPECIES: rod shape-determining protein [Pelosinus]EIW15955.1 cell shape determining protein, MreB/Mrl family [Pelosinus fermentans B4]EIW27339.1 cell shape determining protein, MreB/Mrl family [Pelosinus fermentans A11]OAM92704.1 cell shape determining protein, MreB/Mrl family [Pelosinus fermentans DSM 17108]SDQ54271.1 rod shape-determining protein MreB [Pelosinus fermentans]
MFGMSMDIGVDLGTANVLVYIKGKGIVLREPSVVAIDRDSNTVLAVGEEARRMLGRTPGNIIAIRPLREGVIADYDTTETMLRHFISKVVPKNFFFKPRIMVCIPSGVTTVEKRAVLEAAVQAGAKKTYLIEEPLAAALGAGLDISEPFGSMVVDIGGGTTDVAVLSLGGIVVSESLRVGGDKFDEALVRYVKREYNVMIGERTAEQIKVTIGTALVSGRNESMEIRGRDLVSGLPKTLRITSAETFEALNESVSLIVQRVKTVLEITPPELSSDIMDRGIVMTGGGSMLYGLDKLIQQETGIPTYLAEDPLSCVALGTGKALDSLGSLEDSLTTLKRGSIA